MSLLERIEDDILHAIKHDGVMELQSFLRCGGMSINHVFTSTRDTNAHGLTLLHAAILYGANNTINRLFKKKCKLNKAAQCISFDGDKSKVKIKSSRARLPWTCLYRAILMQNTDMVRCLVRAGASVNFYDAEKRTPLHYAVNANNEALARVILESAKCRINQQDKRQLSALHLAAKNRTPDMMILLLGHGVNVDLADENGATALHTACQIKDPAIVKVLLQYGADPNIKDKDNCTPVILLLMKGDNHTLIQMLLTAGAFVYSHTMLQPISQFPMLEEEPDLHDCVQSYLDNARSLKVLCSLTIKHAVKMSAGAHSIALPQAISRILLPAAPKRYLLLTELEYIQ